MRMHNLHALVLLIASFSNAHATSQAEPAPGDFEQASADITRQLEESLTELSQLRQRIGAEMTPLNRQLGDLEQELAGVRQEYQQAVRRLDSRTLDLGNLRTEIKAGEDEATYISNLLGEYTRNFESRLHIAEVQRYEEALQAAKLAPENGNLSQQEVFLQQTALLATALERLHDALGGSRFEGSAVDANGLVRRGTFVLVGPAALFRSADGEAVGTAEQRLGSLEPAVIGFPEPRHGLAATQLVTSSEGRFPLDPTLGNAHKIAATHETFLEHVKKGGLVMVPIFAMAAAALLVALWKWIGLAFLRAPSRRKIDSLLEAVARQDELLARERAEAIGGPTGQMLTAGVAHLQEPRELIEEVMYETLLTTRLQLQRFLPFIAICAASAPLLGLLGTVTGIINTFKLITVFGSGDVKSLSGGISEALITTKFGLIVAIPSLLLHAFLSRKARSVTGHMETSAVAFVNQVGKARHGRAGDGSRGSEQADVLRAQVDDALRELLTPFVEQAQNEEPARTGRPSL